MNDYRETIWKMIVVDQSEYLEENTLVAIKALSTDQPTQNLYLTVFRNEQGQFLPSISTSGEAAFWRLQRPPATYDAKEQGGSIFREGDTVRLCWRFSDQTSGFRDFYEDIFGRLRHVRPAEIPDELFIKAPFPGFQKLDELQRDARALVMDPNRGRDPFYGSIPVVAYNLDKSKDGDFTASQVTYNLFDLTFRLDVLGEW